MAGDLLYIESAIDGLQAKRFDPTGTTLPGMLPQTVDEEEFVVPEGEYQDVLNVIMQEMTNDISLCKESIVAFLDAQSDASSIESVVDKFRNISGAFSMLQLNQASVLVDGVMSAIQQYLINETTQDEAVLDHLANSVTGIEYYIEGVYNYRFSDNFMLNVMQENLEAIGQTIAAVEAPVVVAPVAKGVEAEPEPVVDTVVEATPVIAEPKPAEVVEPEPELEDIKAEPTISVAPVASPTPAPGNAAPLLEEIDEEILEIFMEEAKEELENIQVHYPKWKNERDQESLSIIRRSFHTLKGSGRLVGALVIGEFAWAVENLLNRVIDGTVDLGPQMFLVLDDVVTVLPELVQCQEEGTQPTCDVIGISARAEIISKPGGESELAAMAPTEIAVAAVAETETVEPVSEVAEAEVVHAAIEMDDVLHDIFTTECSTHIQAVQDFIAACEDSGGCQCDEGLIRSVHTLHGSAHMANVTQIAVVSAALEKLIKVMIKTQAEADTVFIALVNDVMVMIQTFMDSINKPDAVLPDHEAMIVRIHAYQNQYNADDVSEIVLTVDLSKTPELQPAPVDEVVPEIEQVEVSGPDEIIPAVEDVAPVEIVPEPVAEVITPEVATVAEVDEEEMDEELIEIFLEESRDIVDVMEQTVQQWTNAPEDSALIADLQRSLHTLKGGARLSGLGMIGDVSHSLESLLTGIGNRSVSIHDEIINLVHRSVDELDKMLQVVQAQKEPEPAGELLDLIDDALAGRILEPFVQSNDEADEEDTDDDNIDEASSVDEPADSDVVEAVADSQPEVAAKKVAEPTAEAKAPKSAQEFVKIRSNLLDTLVNYAGEISIYRSRLEQQNGNFLFNLTELDQTVSRLRNQLRNLEIETEAQMLFRYEKEHDENEDEEEFDPLEMDRFSKMQQLSRSLLESVTDLTSIQEMMSNLARESETLLLQQARVNTELQEGLMRTRMMPFSSMVPKLNRLVRQTCKQLGKKAELEVIGAAGEMDRTIMERMMAPLEHMIRNAIAHGVEDKDVRKSRLKPETGKITLQLTREGTDIVLYVADDGGGIGVDRVRKKAIERDLMKEDQTDLSEEDILQFILESGFSTADEVSQIAGRGVGMDVVHSEIKQLGGSLHIDSQKTTVRYLPLDSPLPLRLTKRY